MLEVGEARAPAVNARRAVIHGRCKNAVAQPAEPCVRHAADMACTRARSDREKHIFVTTRVVEDEIRIEPPRTDR